MPTLRDFRLNTRAIPISSPWLKITATDHVHGIRIPAVPDGAAKGTEPGLVFTAPAPNDCYRLEKGPQVTVEIEAKTPGTYRFKCCVRCGLGHGGMKGELIVDR